MVESLLNSGLAELLHLSTFVRAAEQGSFTAAASQLGITQAAVSQRTAMLEKELRVSLFNRQAGRIALTDAGQRLYKYARQILDLHQQAQKNLGGFHPLISGDLPIAASSVPGEYFLPPLLSAFHSNHPSVGRKTVSLRALKSERLIIREPRSGSRCALEKGLARAGTSLAALNVTLELGSNAAIKDAVRRGLLVAFLSQLAVQTELGSNELQSVAVKGLDLERDFYLVFNRRHPLSPAATAFLHFLEMHPFEAGRP